jgi:acetylornithine deacetylase
MAKLQDVQAEAMGSAEMLARLVSFDTTSRNSNLGLIDFARGWLDRHGVCYRVSTDRTGTKANIHAIVGPEVAGGVALSGHVDVVPVDGQAWSADPFLLRREGGRLYGRGSADMKGFVACCLAAVPKLKAAGLKRPVHLFITYDEETDMGGARRLIADLGESGLAPAMCVVGEPSRMLPIVAHKGKLSIRAIVRGLAGHSSEPGKGVNAVQAAAEAIAWAAAEQRRFAAEGPFAEGFDPPHTTPHVGTVAGGSILNIIPHHAEFTMEWRCIPADDPMAEMARLQAFVAGRIEPAMKAVDSACGFAWEIIDDIPGMALDAGHELATLTKRLAGSNAVGKVSYGTEGGLYERAGIPTIVCGPGDIAQAHKPDEFIEQAQLDACDGFIARLAAHLSG